ncbi:MAG: hypothetical protein HY720_12095 [Planctomycetes bacterium]|nr:hypothetical protein [Planctomycetota bacterium]
MSQSAIPATAFSVETFLEDVRRGAQALRAPCDLARTRQMVELFDRESREGVIQFRAASIEKSPLNYRIGCLPDVDWLARAEESGQVPRTPTAERAKRFLREARERFPASFYLGADFDVATGLEKVYLLFVQPVPFEEFLALPSVPPGLREKRGALERHDFHEVVIAAADLVKGSANVYFVWRRPSAAWLDGFAGEWGHGPIPASTKEEILRSTPIHGSVATTWTWDRPVPRRWCVYAIALRYDRPAAYEPGGELAGFRLPLRHERFARFDEVVGTQTDRVAYGIGWSFGEPGPYQKYERSYTRDLLSHYQAQTDSIEGK